MAPFSQLHYAILPFLLILLIESASSDFAADQAECGEQLAGLASCLTYVQGEAKTPTPDCCTGLKGVLAKSPKCLCVLIKDRNDPNLGLNMNVTLAVSLPSVCGAHSNISACTKLLNLPPNSKDALMFKQLGDAAQRSASNDTTVKGNSTASAGTSASTHANGGGQINYLGGRKGLLLVQLLLFALSLMVFLVH